VLLNAAAAAQQQGEHAAAAARCTEVLTKVDVNSAKALFRRAVSRTALGDWTARRRTGTPPDSDLSAAADCDRQAAKLRLAQRDAAAAQRAQLRGFLDGRGCRRRHRRRGGRRRVNVSTARRDACPPAPSRALLHVHVTHCSRASPRALLVRHARARRLGGV
jgi:hypothetical protein